jgi:uncharacterized membrane protein
MLTTRKQLESKTRTLTLAVFIALGVANVQSVFAQKTYHIYTLAETFDDSVIGLQAIAANGTFLGYAQDSFALITRNSIQPIGDPPGLFGAGYTGINASLTMAGTAYLEDFSDSVAFVRDAGGKFRFLSFPSGAMPVTTGINDNGDVVGFYYGEDLEGPVAFRPFGFIADQKGVRTIDVPGAADVQLTGINASGTVVGNYMVFDGNFEQHSFIMDNKGITEFTIPGAKFVTVNCINNNGAIGGWYNDGTKAHAFVSKGGKISIIDYARSDLPASITRNVRGNEVVFVRYDSYPQVTSINDRGDIVGYTTDYYMPTDPNLPFGLLFQQSFLGSPLP